MKFSIAVVVATVWTTTVSEAIRLGQNDHSHQLVEDDNADVNVNDVIDFLQYDGMDEEDKPPEHRALADRVRRRNWGRLAPGLLNPNGQVRRARHCYERGNSSSFAPMVTVI